MFGVPLNPIFDPDLGRCLGTKSDVFSVYGLKLGRCAGVLTAAVSGVGVCARNGGR